MSGTEATAGSDDADASGAQLLQRAEALCQSWEEAGRHPAGRRPEAGVTEQVLRDLTEAADRAQAAGQDGERRALRTARGMLLATRCLVDRDDGRDEALALLREARVTTPVTEAQERHRDAVSRLLLRLLVSQVPVPSLDGRENLTRAVTVGLSFLTPGQPDHSALRQELAEASTIIEELAQTADPAARVEMERGRAMLRMLESAGDREGLLRLVDLVNAAGTMPPEVSRILNGAVELLRSMPGDADFDPAGTDTSDPAQQVHRTMDQLLPLLDLMAPGVLSAGDAEDLAERLPLDSWQDQVTASLVRLGVAVRTGDPEALTPAAELLHRASSDPEAPAEVMNILRAGLFSASSMSGGNLADVEAARSQLAEQFGGRGDTVGSMPEGPQARMLAQAARAMLLLQRISDTPEDDLDTLDDIGDILLELRQGLTDDDASANIVLFVLGVHQLRRAQALGHAGGAVAPALRRAVMYLRESREHPAVPVALREVMPPVQMMTRALEQMLDSTAVMEGGLLEDIGKLRASLGGPTVFADQDLRTRTVIAITLSLQYDRTRDPAFLDDALRELEAARAAIGDHTSCASAQEVYRLQADYLRRRGADGDTERALEATERLLEKVAEDVLLQIGAEHGLAAARAAADRGVTAAVWAAESGDGVTALRVLEAGRALVLRAVATSTSVPDQLDELCEHQLAARWRDAARQGTDPVAQPADTADGALHDAPSETEGSNAEGSGTTPSAPVESLIPSRLRRRALAVLRSRSGPAAASGWEEIADAAGRNGVDAVVYLLAGAGDGPGWALVVRPGAAPLPLVLDGLGSAARGPLERYLDAARDRSALMAPGAARSSSARADAVAVWKDALDELCTWAGPAVMAPVLDVVRPGRPPRPDDPARLVLLPAGNLGSVPWHAARLGDLPGGDRPAHAVDRAVISYAASGAEFVRSAARARMPVGDAPVLVADPRYSLAYAPHEVEGLRNGYYPGARIFGFLPALDRAIDGTPDQLLPLLPGSTAHRPASLVQFSVHGFAGGRPTVSGLLLHPRPADGSGLREGGEDDAGVLTVRRLLGAPSGVPDAAGPLIVLSACETDLSTRDHDETLTLTTAFVARGAADVIGSKWAVSDAGAAVLMNVLHHYLAEGEDPARALRRTQLWALDAGRPEIPGLSPPLRARVRGRVALPVDVWAPFIHQGSPAPVTAPSAPYGKGNTVGHE
ncbi:CHAT domain-containing protein [Streptomyces longwoodensis]|uniref:CHAT domain-containing protein n=1 Tax=Streptomyces longwoodensis TaxID=68231 RepID=UPI0036F8D379